MGAGGAEYIHNVGSVHTYSAFILQPDKGKALRGGGKDAGEPKVKPNLFRL